MRAAAVLVALTALGAGLWHARPVLVWHLTVHPEIERLGRSDRIHLDTDSLQASPDPAWPRLTAGRLALRAPLVGGQEEGCRSCPNGCSLELGLGRLAVIDSALPTGFEQALATFAPSAEDVSLWRPAVLNWASVEGLAARASLSKPPPEAFRYRGDRTQGIVTRFQSGGSERFVAYVYALDGRPAGIVATSRTGKRLLQRILGGITVGDTMRAPGCTEGGAWATRQAEGPRGTDAR